MTRYTDQDINELVFKAIVPKGLRPDTPEEIDAMLDALGEISLSEDEVQRMLRKIRGEETLGDPAAERGREGRDDAGVEMSDAELALYRNRNEDIPPEVEGLLQDMENEALEAGEEDEDDSEDDA